MSTLNTYNLKSPDSANTNLALDASGNVAIQAGSASAPSVYVTGDANTGLYSPGADQVALTTGGTARLYISSTGQVGIGTTSASATLHVSGSGVPLILNCTSANSNNIIFQINGSARGYIGPAGNLGGSDNDMGYRVESGNNQVFYVGSSEAARIDSSRRLLVGTSSARGGWYNTTGTSVSPVIQTDGTSFNTSSIALAHNENAAGEAARIVLGKSRGSTAGSFTVVQNNDDLGGITFQGADGTNFVEGAHIKAFVDGTPGADDLPSRLTFSTTADGASSPTERMRIASSGLTTLVSTDHCYNARHTGPAGLGNYLFYGYHSATAGNPSSGTLSFLVYSNGNVQNTNGSYTALSDAKLKENIADAASQWNDLKTIKIRNWNFKAETGHETHRQIGPIAQELETVCPGLVFNTPDRDEDGNETGEVTKGVNQSVLYMKAVKALQEAMERIEQLEAKVAALESA